MASNQAQPCLAGVFIIALMFIGLLGGLHTLWSANQRSYPLDPYLDGTVAKDYEKTYSREHLFTELAKNLWGQTEYAVFGQGRKGVVVSEDGALYTTEEFTVDRHRNALFDQHLNFINQTIAQLNESGVEVVIALIPSKAPSQNTLYDKAMSKISAPDLRPAFSPPESFLKYDTHWSPEGAKRAAGLIAAQIETRLTKARFETEPRKTISHEGDLSRYIPGVVFEEPLRLYETRSLEEANATGLFGEQNIEVTLVGTSYSADPNWHFEGFLKSALQADVLNMADEGKGPFAVMRDWLDSENFKAHKSRVVIWEIPLRYMVLPEGE